MTMTLHRTHDKEAVKSFDIILITGNILLSKQRSNLVAKGVLLNDENNPTFGFIFLYLQVSRDICLKYVETASKAY